MKDIDSIIVATTNLGKLAELRQLLAPVAIEVRSLADFESVPEFEETGTTFEENARQKALFYARRLGGVVLADDSGLQVDALDGAPGVYSARYAGVSGPDRDAANNRKLLEALRDVPDARRTARFRCCLSLVRDDRVLLEVCGVIEGVIGREPRGENGFGYDPLFYIPGEGKTAAELSKETKNRISHRGRAFQKLLAALESGRA